LTSAPRQTLSCLVTKMPGWSAHRHGVRQARTGRIVAEAARRQRRHGEAPTTYVVAGPHGASHPAPGCPSARVGLGLTALSRFGGRTAAAAEHHAVEIRPALPVCCGAQHALVVVSRHDEDRHPDFPCLSISFLSTPDHPRAPVPKPGACARWCRYRAEYSFSARKRECSGARRPAGPSWPPRVPRSVWLALRTPSPARPNRPKSRRDLLLVDDWLC